MLAYKGNADNTQHFDRHLSGQRLVTVTLCLSSLQIGFLQSVLL